MTLVRILIFTCLFLSVTCYAGEYILILSDDSNETEVMTDDLESTIDANVDCPRPTTETLTDEPIQLIKSMADIMEDYHQEKLKKETPVEYSAFYKNFFESRNKDKNILDLVVLTPGEGNTLDIMREKSRDDFKQIGQIILDEGKTQAIFAVDVDKKKQVKWQGEGVFAKSKTNEGSKLSVYGFESKLYFKTKETASRYGVGVALKPYISSGVTLESINNIGQKTRNAVSAEIIKAGNETHFDIKTKKQTILLVFTGSVGLGSNSEQSITPVVVGSLKLRLR